MPVQEAIRGGLPRHNLNSTAIDIAIGAATGEPGGGESPMTASVSLQINWVLPRGGYKNTEENRDFRSSGERYTKILKSRRTQKMNIKGGVSCAPHHF